MGKKKKRKKAQSYIITQEMDFWAIKQELE